MKVKQNNISGKDSWKLNSVQYLRGIAAVLVVYSHNQYAFATSYQPSFLFLQHFGAIGVDIFFVISGFIISYMSSNIFGINASLDFIKKRFIRINPSYYLVSMLALFFRYLSKPNTIFPLDEVVKTITIIPIFETGIIFKNPILATGWTLAFEWLFYLFYSILIAISIKNKNLILVILLVLLILIFQNVNLTNIQLIFISNPIILEFCLGVLIAEYYKKFDLGVRMALLSFGFGILSYTILIFMGYINTSDANDTLSSKNSFERFLLWGLPSSMIVLGVIFLEKYKVFVFDNKVMLLIGNASYSIYLIHLLCFSFFKVITQRYIKLNTTTYGDIYAILTLVCAILCGIGYYIFIEKRMLQFLKNISTKSMDKKIPQLNLTE